MPCDDWLHCHCYRRRTILGLALLPLLVGPAHADEEGEADEEDEEAEALLRQCATKFLT